MLKAHSEADAVGYEILTTGGICKKELKPIDLASPNTRMQMDTSMEISFNQSIPLSSSFSPIFLTSFRSWGVFSQPIKSA